MGRLNAAQLRSVAPFFVLRTPLLPADTFVRLGDDLTATAACRSGQDLESSIEHDRSLISSRLRELASAPEIHEALYLASPSLVRELASSDQLTPAERSRVDMSLMRYVTRMACRATPFGSFAGYAIGRTAEATSLRVSSVPCWRRNTRVDMQYVVALCEVLGRDRSLRERMTLYPNSSLYRLGNQWRFVQHYAPRDGRRQYNLASVPDEEPVPAIVAAARVGVSFDALVRLLVSDEVDEHDARDYVHQLLDAQVLFTELQPVIHGDDALVAATRTLRRVGASAAGVGEDIVRSLNELDARPLGVSVSEIKALETKVRSLPGAPQDEGVLHVDTYLPATEVALGTDVVAELLRGAHAFCALSAHSQNPLREFREAFEKRFESRQVPLAEVFDEESGLQFGGATTFRGGDAPLLDGLAFSREETEPLKFDRRELALLSQLATTGTGGGTELKLSETDVADLTGKPPSLPGSFAVLGHVIASGPEALGRGDFRVFIRSVVKAAGAGLLGRFTVGDATLRNLLADHLLTEEQARPDVVFAEIVHLPQGRGGNVIARGTLRSREIRYLGHSSLPCESQVPLDDLVVSIENGNVVLRSIYLQRQVIPRMANAHAPFVFPNLPLYRFLYTMQAEGNFLGWSMELAERVLPFIPRITVGKSVISCAQWQFSEDEFRQVSTGTAASRFRAVQELRDRRGLPRYVVHQTSQSELVADLENVVSTESLLKSIASSERKSVTEWLPGATDLCAECDRGRRVHEVVVPFSSAGVPHVHSEKGNASRRRTSGGRARRTLHAPGGDWLFAKLYCGPRTADRLLTEVVSPLVAELESSALIDRWFFIRYGDPDWHVRLRLHGKPDQLLAEVMPRLHRAVGPHIASSAVTRFQLDIYEPEVERYGGADAIESVEQVFHVDSAAAVRMLPLFRERADRDLRWQAALLSISCLLEDFGLPDMVGDAVLVEGRAACGSSAGWKDDGVLRRRLGSGFRERRSTIRSLLTHNASAQAAVRELRDVTFERSQRLAPAVHRLRTAESEATLTQPLDAIVRGIVHMSVNRLLDGAHRQQEFVLYDYLLHHRISERAKAMQSPQSVRRSTD